MENVVVLAFRASEEAHESVGGLRRLHDAGEIRLAAVAVLGRKEDGTTMVLDQAEDVHIKATATGGAVGAIIGLFSGPVGLLVGGATGAVVGSLVDIAELESSDDVLRTFAAAVPRGHTATIAVIEEPTHAAVDALAADLGIAAIRRSRAAVERQIAAAEEAAIARRRDVDAKRSIGDRLRDVKEAVVDRH